MGIERKDVIVGGIEAGGTKFVCAIGRRPDDVWSYEVDIPPAFFRAC